MPPFTVKPFIVRVQKVTSGGADVDSASFVLTNLTTGGSTTARSSDQSDSNFTIPLADVSGADWTVGNTIKIAATKGAETGSESHTILTNEGAWNAGIITITTAGAATGLRITSTHTPSSSSDTGATGQFGVDEKYLYYCCATNSWVRAAWSVF